MILTGKRSKPRNTQRGVRPQPTNGKTTDNTADTDLPGNQEIEQEITEETEPRSGYLSRSLCDRDRPHSGRLGRLLPACFLRWLLFSHPQVSVARFVKQRFFVRIRVIRAIRGLFSYPDSHSARRTKKRTSCITKGLQWKSYTKLENERIVR